MSGRTKNLGLFICDFVCNDASEKGNGSLKGGLGKRSPHFYQVINFITDKNAVDFLKKKQEKTRSMGV